MITLKNTKRPWSSHPPVFHFTLCRLFFHKIGELWNWCTRNVLTKYIKTLLISMNGHFLMFTPIFLPYLLVKFLIMYITYMWYARRLNWCRILCIIYNCWYIFYAMYTIPNWYDCNWRAPWQRHYIPFPKKIDLSTLLLQFDISTYAEYLVISENSPYPT